jgi:hypothetical protein
MNSEHTDIEDVDRIEFSAYACVVWDANLTGVFYVHTVRVFSFPGAQ